MSKLKIKLDNLDHDDVMVSVYCDDKEAAKFDQSIMGSMWEAPSDMDIAYAIIDDEPDLVKKLEAEGYDVDDDEYCPDDHQVEAK